MNLAGKREGSGSATGWPAAWPNGENAVSGGETRTPPPGFCDSVYRGIPLQNFQDLDSYPRIPRPLAAWLLLAGVGTTISARREHPSALVSAGGARTVSARSRL
jgi:hypothetical protein